MLLSIDKKNKILFLISSKVALKDFVFGKIKIGLLMGKKLGLTGFGELKAILKEVSDNKIANRDLFWRTYHDIVEYIDRYEISQLKDKLFESKEIYIRL